MTDQHNPSDPLSRADAADRIWGVVEPTGEDGLRGPEICERAELKRSQFENGKAQARDYKAVEEGKGFIYDGDVYVVTRNPGRCAKALALRLRSIDRQLHRLHSSACAPLDDETINSDPALRYLKRQVEAMMDNMAILRQSGYSATSKRIRSNAGAA